MTELPERYRAVLLAAHRFTLSYPGDRDAWNNLCEACEHITDAEIIDLTNAASRPLDTEADAIARALDVGCEYCGTRTGLERHTAPRSRRVKFRCIDADACNARELAATKSEEDADA